jgi:hypothetical protein
MSAHWESNLSPLAFSCDYLLHGILSTAALHLAYLCPDKRDKYNVLSARHYDIALPTFRKAISVITSENCHQVFGFSLLLIVSHFASFPSRDFLFSEAVPNSSLSNWIVSLRGAQSIMKQARSYISSSPTLGPLTDWRKEIFSATAGGTQFVEDETDKSLMLLLDHLTSSPSMKNCTTIVEMETYISTTYQLRRLLTASAMTSDSLSRRAFSCIWPVIISDTFIRLLSEQRPPALAITAHYCLLLQKISDCWYMERRAYELFDIVQQGLDSEWSAYILYPRRIFVDCYASPGGIANSV